MGKLWPTGRPARVYCAAHIGMCVFWYIDWKVQSSVAFLGWGIWNEVPRLHELGTTLQYPQFAIYCRSNRGYTVGAAGPTSKLWLEGLVQISCYNPLKFYGSLPEALFPHLKNFAAKLLSLFGSIYICEQDLSCLKINKWKNRSMLTDFNLNAVMWITTSKRVPQFKNIIQNCEHVSFILITLCGQTM